MDDLNNIYHSTQVEVAAAIDDSNELTLATAVQRIVAWLINRVIEVVLMIPAFGLIIVLLFKSGGKLDDFENMQTVYASLFWGIGLVMLLYLIYGVVQVYYMSKFGQSIGKKLMKIRVVRENGDVAGFVHNVLLREFVYGLICSVIMMVLMGIFFAVFGLEANSGVAMVVDALLQIVSYLPTIICFIMLFMEAASAKPCKTCLPKPMWCKFNYGMKPYY